MRRGEKEAQVHGVFGVVDCHLWSTDSAVKIADGMNVTGVSEIRAKKLARCPLAGRSEVYFSAYR